MQRLLVQILFVFFMIRESPRAMTEIEPIILICTEYVLSIEILLGKIFFLKPPSQFGSFKSPYFHGRSLFPVFLPFLHLFYQLLVFLVFLIFFFIFCLFYWLTWMDPDRSVQTRTDSNCNILQYFIKYLM